MATRRHRSSAVAAARYEWCPDPACAFWHGWDRWTGMKVG
jgi:hypothetical protein